MKARRVIDMIRYQSYAVLAFLALVLVACFTPHVLASGDPARTDATNRWNAGMSKKNGSSIRPPK